MIQPLPSTQLPINRPGAANMSAGGIGMPLSSRIGPWSPMGNGGGIPGKGGGNMVGSDPGKPCGGNGGILGSK